MSERVTGIEPALSAWEADVLPLNYTRVTASSETMRKSPVVIMPDQADGGGADLFD